MANVFDVIFYKFFRFNKKIGNVNNDNFYASKSVAFLVVLVYLNLGALWFIFNGIKKVYHLLAPPIFLSLLVMAAIWWLFHRSYLKGENYKRRMERVQQYPKAIGVIGSVLTILYTIASFATPLLMAAILSPHNH